jgi:hypothetical protein
MKFLCLVCTNAIQGKNRKKNNLSHIFVLNLYDNNVNKMQELLNVIF